MERLTPEACYRALETRDPRFDGRLYVGVKTTGIYCRPICPARTPKRENCQFFVSAAAAQQAGFRPCLRCRPETAPDAASWRGTSSTVSRALALIAEGALDGQGSVDTLAGRLGMGERQLRRLFQQHLGATPLAVARTRRVLFAKQLIHETKMPMGQIALAAGFGSVRRFNATFQELFGRPPERLRRRTTEREAAADTAVVLDLRYRAPYDWEAILNFLAARALDQVETVEHGVYRRTLAGERGGGTVEVKPLAAKCCLRVTIRLGLEAGVRLLPAVVARVRRVFDLGADITTIAEHLSADPLLAPLVAERPGLRAPGGWDGFELAVRAVLGQQVTVEAGRRLGSRLVTLFGSPFGGSGSADERLSLLFPTAERLAQSDLSALGMPEARRRTLQAVARAALADPLLFQTHGTVDEARTRLLAIPGVGPWTAEYIALRALREPDAFPASDIVLLRQARGLTGVLTKPQELVDRAEPWRPWRAYAAQHLWAAAACR